jgi:hypothetical protein
LFVVKCCNKLTEILLFLFLGTKIKKNDRDEETKRVVSIRVMRNVYRIWSKNLEGGDSLRYVCVDETILSPFEVCYPRLLRGSVMDDWIY